MPFGGEHYGEIISISSWEEFLMGYRMIQHRMEEMNPFIGIRLGHPKELPLDFLDGVLFYVGQDEEQFVRYRRQGTVVIRTVTSAGAGLPIDRAVLQIGHERPLEMRQQRREFFLG
jgi:hypothetical protein